MNLKQNPEQLQLLPDLDVLEVSLIKFAQRHINMVPHGLTHFVHVFTMVGLAYAGS
jgi:hypothetical protein